MCYHGDSCTLTLAGKCTRGSVLYQQIVSRAVKRYVVLVSYQDTYILFKYIRAQLSTGWFAKNYHHPCFIRVITDFRL